MPGPHEYLHAKWGFSVTADERLVSVAAGPTTLLQNSPKRVSWIICNVGAYPISVSTRPETGYGDGLLVPPDGGTVSEVLDEDGIAVTYPLYARASGGTTSVWVYEVWQV